MPGRFDREMTFTYKCEDCGKTWPGHDTMPQTRHAIGKGHRVFKITTELYLDGSRTHAG